MSIIKQYKGKAIIRLNHIYICIDVKTGDVKAKGSFEKCNRALEV